MHCFNALAALVSICRDRSGSSTARAMEIAPTRTLRVRTASRSPTWRSRSSMRSARADHDYPGVVIALEAWAGHQYCVVAPELLTTAPTISGRSNTDWAAARPGPCSVSHTDLASHRAELNQ